ncbi:MAG TPA: hypothetical protein VIB01_07690 [Steroidobacteraceae bacterium]|jgi:hypothetical protein
MYSLIAMAALATAEFCAEPIDGGRGELQFCRFEHAQTIYTPYFSVDIQPAWLAGVDQSGRRMMAKSSTRHGPATILVLASETRVWSGCRIEESESAIGSMVWSICDESAQGLVQRKLTAQGSDGYLSIVYSYTGTDTPVAELVEQMLRSIRPQP